MYAERGGSVLGVETVPRSETDKYGIVATEEREGRVSRVKQIVEKPRPQNAPSTLAVVGRYLLSPTIFAKLEQTGRGAGGEIQLTDAIADLLADEPVYAYEFEGKRYDCGSKLGYLQATVEYGLKHESAGREVQRVPDRARVEAEIALDSSERAISQPAELAAHRRHHPSALAGRRRRRRRRRRRWWRRWRCYRDVRRVLRSQIVRHRQSQRERARAATCTVVTGCEAIAERRRRARHAEHAPLIRT